jgi:hypothetical protein
VMEKMRVPLRIRLTGGSPPAGTCGQGVNGEDGPHLYLRTGASDGSYT